MGEKGRRAEEEEEEEKDEEEGKGRGNREEKEKRREGEGQRGRGGGRGAYTPVDSKAPTRFNRSECQGPLHTLLEERYSDVLM